ncbi:platelet basic protein-like [Odontesthes bonariensis]|uniref:platelet basic protein-like n=1 Tax=Odontesthes bonariensis TaxID=219752 RepID=UPI003F58D4AF
MSHIITVALLLLLATHEGSSMGDQGVIQRCQCITKEKRPIGRLVGMVEVNLPNSHCKDIEIIATLKKDGRKICLDPDALGVKKVLKFKLPGQTP